MPSRQNLIRFVLPSAALAVAGLLLFSAAYDTRSVDRMLPHGYCFTWQPALLVTHVGADALIGLAYTSIPITLLTFVRRRTDIPFNWIAVLFALFIITCGLTHFMHIWTIWRPDYWLSGMVKAICAAVSLPTAAVLVYLMPRLLTLPTAQQMTLTLQALEREIGARREAEEALRSERDALEIRVAERTAALEAANAAELQARARAEAANVAKDRFLASVSHELRTPLQSMLGWTQILALDASLPAPLRSAVDRIQGSVRSQARIIDDLLDLSRIVAGKVAVDIAVVPVASVVGKAVDGIRHRAEARQVALDVRTQGCGLVEADPERLQQVISNLLTNAINASPQGRTIHVACDERDQRMVVSVRDEGVGIEPEELDGLFEPFRQGRHRAGGGLGLGLAISRSLVEQMGGALHGRSDGPGRGATFEVALRVAGGATSRAWVADEQQRMAATQRLRARLDGHRLLYVEDDDDIREPVAGLMRTLGLQVEALSAFAPARAAVERGGFDLLVCDLRLDGGHSGLELVRTLRARGGRQPAIAVSAYGLASDVAASREAGFDDHVTKPVDGYVLAERIAAWLERPTKPD